MQRIYCRCAVRRIEIAKVLNQVSHKKREEMKENQPKNHIYANYFFNPSAETKFKISHQNGLLNWPLSYHCKKFRLKLNYIFLFTLSNIALLFFLSLTVQINLINFFHNNSPLKEILWFC